MNVLNEVMTFPEACKIWGLGDSTLRAKVSEFVKGTEIRKSGNAWLITRSAMEKRYGEPKK